MATISLEKLTKDYGNHKGVFDLDLTIESGEFFVILGPSGCGKTTTLRIIAGLEYPNSGKVYLDDEDITDYPPRNRNMSMVFQNYALYPFMTVRENISFPLKKMKMDKSDIDKKVDDMASVLSITDILDKKPGQISGGQRQRVALGRAIVKEPKVFLMDEPLSNLDAKLRIGMRAELKRIQMELKTTTVYVTHDQIEAMTLADRVVVMNNGNLEQLDMPMKIYEKPANSFIASFLGDPPINFLEAELAKEGENTFLIIGDNRIILNRNIGNYVGKVVKVGIRPEDIRISNSGIRSKITFIQPLGRRRLEHFKIAANGTELIRASSAEQTLNVGDECFIDFNNEKILLFNKENGKII
ncbi:MAG: ABC transporter ATP-binding protein [Candidatus Thermoplasmatota archaeon]|nr:ABC transporter ATP-binding protein [Candidatus Thermoplasmatota archaeon]MCL5680510.1 ABC transporter ATP-binding protein [Candidatus Thermoplasmatota archaeon]